MPEMLDLVVISLSLFLFLNTLPLSCTEPLDRTSRADSVMSLW